jgi:hypothetical protein
MPFGKKGISSTPALCRATIEKQNKDKILKTINFENLKFDQIPGPGYIRK